MGVGVVAGVGGAAEPWGPGWDRTGNKSPTWRQPDPIPHITQHTPSTEAFLWHDKRIRTASLLTGEASAAAPPPSETGQRRPIKQLVCSSPGLGGGATAPGLGVKAVHAGRDAPLPTTLDSTCSFLNFIFPGERDESEVGESQRR